MLGHIGINVPDLKTARDYYGQLMPLVGFELFLDSEDQFAFMPAGGKRGTYLFVYPTQEPGAYSRHQTGLQHLAFMVSTRSAVRSVHEHVAALGSEVLHAPREFPEYFRRTSQPFGSIHSASCSKPSAITTVTDILHGRAEGWSQTPGYRGG